MEPVILRGEAPSDSGDDYGDGYGYGFGFGFGDGYGFGFGDGYGFGYGDGFDVGSGYGYGYGYGYGSGDVSGYGYSNGDGYGEGYGEGYGYGFGFGYGSGDVSGYGYGYGSGAYWQAAIPEFAAGWPAEQRHRLAALQAEGATIAYWRSDPHGLSANGGRPITPAAPGVVHEIEGPLRLCGPGALHATLRPDLWKGERWWIVALTGEVIRDDTKMGALRREIIGECV